MFTAVLLLTVVTLGSDPTKPVDTASRQAQDNTDATADVGYKFSPEQRLRKARGLLQAIRSDDVHEVASGGAPIYYFYEPDDPFMIAALVQAIKSEKAAAGRLARRGMGLVTPRDTGSVRAFLSMFEHEDSDVRLAAVKGIGRSTRLRKTDQVTADAVGKRLEDADVLVRVSAALTLGCIGRKANSTIPKMIDILRDEGTGNAEQLAAAYAIANVKPGDPQARPALKKLLDHEDVRIRRWASHALDPQFSEQHVYQIPTNSDEAAVYVLKNRDVALAISAKTTATNLEVRVYGIGPWVVPEECQIGARSASGKTRILKEHSDNLLAIPLSTKIPRKELHFSLPRDDSFVVSEVGVLYQAQFIGEALSTRDNPDPIKTLRTLDRGLILDLDLRMHSKVRGH